MAHLPHGFVVMVFVVFVVLHHAVLVCDSDCRCVWIFLPAPDFVVHRGQLRRGILYPRDVSHCVRVRLSAAYRVRTSLLIPTCIVLSSPCHAVYHATACAAAIEGQSPVYTSLICCCGALPCVPTLGSRSPRPSCDTGAQPAAVAAAAKCQGLDCIINNAAGYHLYFAPFCGIGVQPAAILTRLTNMCNSLCICSATPTGTA